MVFRAEFLFQIELLFRQSLFQFSHFTVGQGVIQSDGHVAGNLLEQFNMLSVKCALLSADQVQRSEHPVLGDER